ncbi:MAG: hypothetical protein WAM92_03815 [Mycobacterium sp.]
MSLIDPSRGVPMDACGYCSTLRIGFSQHISACSFSEVQGQGRS